MRVPSNTLCTVRSTMPVVVLLVSTFILFDSYNWKLFSISWSRPDSPSYSPSHSESTPFHTVPKQTPNSTTSGTDVTHNVTTPDFLSVRDYDDDKGGIPGSDKRLHSPTDDNIREESSQGKQKISVKSDNPAAGNHGASSAPSKYPAVPPPGLFPQDSGAGDQISRIGITEHAKDPAKSPNLTAREFDSDTSTPDSGPGEDELDKAKFTATHPENGAPPSSSKRAVTPGTADAIIQTGGSEAAASSIANEGVAHETPYEVVATPKVAAPIQKKPTRRYDELSSLQKVELDLWQARAAMRKVVLSQMNSTNVTSGDQSVPDSEPSGDAYRNAAIFRQSYQEMEQRFKVYAYQEGEEPLVHNGPCKEIYAVEGRFIQELQGDNPFVTSDPEAAHVFFLPFSVAMMVTYLYTANSKDMSPLLRFVKDYVHVVSHKYPYWTRSEGADHFMLSCHDWGPHVSRADHNLVSKTIRVLCNANVSEGYVPSKDASLPEIHLVGGEIPAELGGLPPDKRTSLAFFAGGDHGPVRPALFKSWEGKEGDIHVYHQVPTEGPSYHEYMKNSLYCLCPGGYEVNSPRIVEAIYNECVPVVIADNFVLPFSDVLDWQAFAVHVLEKDIPKLRTILEAIPMETYIQMHVRVKKVQHHFLINQPPKRYDVFHMILHSVWLRRLNIQILGK